MITLEKHIWNTKEEGEVLVPGLPSFEDSYFGVAYCRIVQLNIHSDPYLIFGKNRFDNHARIVERFLKANQIHFQWDENPDDSEVPRFPAPKGDAYNLVGASYFKLVDDKELFEGRSATYGLGTNLDQLSQILSMEPLMKIISKDMSREYPRIDVQRV